jgi:hypothetical protein
MNVFKMRHKLKQSTHFANHLGRLYVPNRMSRGGMLVVAIAVAFIMIIGIMATLALTKLFINHQHSQTVADAVALRAARMLNSNDWAGKMNNLVVQSRELVFDSATTHNASTDPTVSYVEPLAHQLLYQARWGAEVVEQGRQRLILEQLKAITYMTLTDPELQRLGAHVVNLEVGTLEDTRSNVYDDEADELQRYDEQKRWIDPKTKRFMGNINATLPDENQDVTFKLSPLHAPTGGRMLQAGLITPETFKKTATLIKDGKIVATTCDQMPPAVRIQIQFPAGQENDFKDLKGKSLLLTSAASTYGGQLVP